jgi:stress-induced morphogen
MVAQHKMVTAALKEEIKNMHGLTLKTKITLE